MLNSRKKYLQIAFNGSLFDVQRKIKLLPKSDQILVEAGTSFIKQYGEEGIRSIKNWWGGYMVADLKCMDRGDSEVKIASEAGANAATVLGLAPIPTIDSFISACAEHQIDSMLDMLNVEFPFEILSKLKKMPTVVVLHRGVDENNAKTREVPYMHINRIVGTYNVLISVAGGESAREVRRGMFNDAHIVVVWKEFNEGDFLINKPIEFLKEVH